MQQFGEFFLKHWDLFLALFGILGMLVFHSFGARLRGYQEAQPSDAVMLINHEDAVVVDVREESEFKQGHIQDSIHIPLGSFVKRVAELEQHKGKPVIVGCRSGARSARACSVLRKQGFERVYNLRGGIMAWESASLPINKGGKRKK